MTKVIRELNAGGERSGLYGELWSSLLTRSFDQTDKLFDILADTPTQINVDDSNLAKRLEIIANLIAGRAERGVQRDFFFVTLDGFDTHADVNTRLAELNVELNAALGEFVRELKLLGVWDSVVIVQTSDFARTLTPNTVRYLCFGKYPCANGHLI